MTVITPSLTVAELTDAAAMARATGNATTITVVATRQIVTVLPSGRITVRVEGEER